MLMAVIMLITWQTTNNGIYQPAFIKAVEATYAHSELEGVVERSKDKLKQEIPLPAAIAPVGYALFIKKQVSVTSTKLSLVPNTVSTYNLDERAKVGSIKVTWSF